MTEQSGPTPPAGPESVQVDPTMVLNRVMASGETGAALVRAASWQVLAEHHAAEAAELREQLAAARAAAGDPAPEGGPSA